MELVELKDYLDTVVYVQMFINCILIAAVVSMLTHR
jgi:hypothetical protein